MTPKLIDVHSHTQFAAYKDDADAVIQRALDAGVWMINVGTQRDTSRAAVEMAEKYPEGVYATIGLHPIHTDKSYHDEKELGISLPSHSECSEESKEILRVAQDDTIKNGGFTSRAEIFDYEYYKKLALHPKVVGIGECGLDYYRATRDPSSSPALAGHYGAGMRQATSLYDIYAQSRAEGFGSEVKRRIMLGTYALSAGYYDAYYTKAQKVRRLIADDFARAFEGVDVIVGPTTPSPAFRIGEKTEDVLAMYLADIYTVAINLAGVPALSLPAGEVTREGAVLPVGLQLIGAWHKESTLFAAAETIETLQR